MIETISQSADANTRDHERGEVFLNHFVEKWVRLRSELEHCNPQHWLLLTDALGPIGAEIEFLSRDGTESGKIQPGTEAVGEAYEAGIVKVRLNGLGEGEKECAVGIFSKDQEQFEIREINIAEMENIAAEEELFETLVYTAQRPFLKDQCEFDEFLDWHPSHGRRSM